MVAMDVSRSMTLGTTRALEARGADLHHRARSCSPRCRTRSTPASSRSAIKVLLSTPPRRTRAAAWTVLEQAWALKPSSSKTLLLPRRPASDDDAEAHERDLHRLGLRHRRRRARAARSWRSSPRKHDVIAVVPEDRAETELPAGIRLPADARHRVRPAGVGRPRPPGARPAMPPRSRSAARSWPARSTACPWTTCSCRPTAARCCPCCRSLPGEKRDPPSCSCSCAFSLLLSARRRAARRSAPCRARVDRSIGPPHLGRAIASPSRSTSSAIAAWTSCSTTSRKRSCGSTGSTSSAAIRRRRPMPRSGPRTACATC